MIKMTANGDKRWVTFTVSPEEGVQNVSVSGAWNAWLEEPMKRKKNGEFYITKLFKAGDCFQFGYKVNNAEWITDADCGSVDSPFFSRNSLLEL